MKIPFFIHFNEVKLRAFFIVLSLLISLCVSFLDPTCVLFIIMRPLWLSIQAPFLFTHPLEGLHASLLAQVFIGFLFSFPLIVYHFWSFLSSSLLEYEKKTLTKTLLFFTSIFAFGFYSFYFGLLPTLCEFFLSYSSSFALLEPRVLDYLIFFIKFFTCVVLSLVTPCILFLGCVYLEKNPKELEELRPWAILFSALLGALVSPAEITSQIVLGFCFYLLYELLLIGLWVHWINLKSKK